MEPLVNLQNLLQHEIDDLYSAEEQIIEALPLMVKNATAPELKKALSEHLRITEEQKKRLDKVKQLFKRMNSAEEPESKSFFERVFGGSTKCKGMEGLITEGQKMMSADMDPQVKDAAIIASAQKIEHYEISGYGTARAFANQLNLDEIERLLQTTLNEEYKSDDLLTVLALKKVNKEAEGDKRAARSNGQMAKKNVPSPNGAAKKGAAAKKSAPKKSAAKKSAPKKKGSKR